MIVIKTEKDIEIMREGGEILAEILQETAKLVGPGVSSQKLEDLARKKIEETGVKPAFLNYETGHSGVYPAVLCISINDEVVHGLPSDDKVFKEGDIVGVDCGIWNKGLAVDAAITVACGDISKEAQKLMNVTKEALNIGIAKCRVGNTIGDIGEAVQRYVKAQGFKIVKTLVGHGIGKKLHEDPQIPNFFPFDHRNPENRGATIKEGMTLAIEPMVSIGSEETKKGTDGYADATKDGSLSAHFEHTVVVTKKGAEILTT